MTDKEKIELELLQLIDENAEPQGGIVLIEETVKGIVYIHFQPELMHYISPKDIFSISGRQMIKESTLLKHIKNRYTKIIVLPHDNRS